MADKLISADALRQRMYHDAFETDTEMQRWDGGCWIRYKMFENALEDAPAVDTEPTEEQVREYCHKRCLTVVTTELFNEMKARWSAEPVRHGRWTYLYDGNYKCSECGAWWTCEGTPIESGMMFCPSCGAKMDGGDGDAVSVENNDVRDMR